MYAKELFETPLEDSIQEQNRFDLFVVKGRPPHAKNNIALN